MRKTEKGNRSSLKVRFTLAMVLMSLIPGLILAVVYYRNVRDFYQDKTWMYQENTLRLMDAKMQDIIKQSEVVLNQVLGLSVTSDLFSGYSEMNAYERLNLMRNINGTLSNIRIANNSIDHIYLLAFDGGAYYRADASGRLQILELRSGGSPGGQYRNVFKPLYGKQRHWAGTD